MKTSELTMALLDYWVARASGEKSPQIHMNKLCVVAHGHTTHRFLPSSEWQHGGPIIERERINLHATDIDDWRAWPGRNGQIYRGETALIAAMRAYVASKFGDEVSESPDAGKE